MTGLQWGALIGLLVSAGVVGFVWWAIPGVPRLGAALAALGGSSPVIETEGGGLQDRLGGWTRRVLPAGLIRTPTTDLALLQQSSSSFYGEKLMLAGIGLVFPLLFTGLLALLGVGVPLEAPALTSLVAATGLFVLPNLTVRQKATQARQQFNYALSSFIDLVALERRHDDFLCPGWVLTLPALDEGTYTVRPGDTLSSIAREHLDDETQWPAIFEASRHSTQPDGGHLVDPDLILPGWTLTLPTPLAEAPEESSVAPTSAPLDEAREPPSLIEPSSAPEAVVPPVAVPPTSSDAARPAPQPAPTAPAASSTSVEVTPTPTPASTMEADDTAVPSPWLLAGLTGAGSLLAGGLSTALRRRREAQFRARRPGRTIAAPAPELAPVERTIIVAGSEASPTLGRVDHALRRLADLMLADHRPVPPLAAVRLTSDRVALHLVEPVELPAPWQPTDEVPDGRQWSLTMDADVAPVTSRAPYPQLVTVGRDDDGATWLVNLEQLGTISLTGDPAHADDFARYLAAEIAVNSWSRDVLVDCIGVGAELVDLDPARI